MPGQDRDQLIPRRAPLRFWLRYYLLPVCLMLGACSTTLPTAYHASERHCKYDRVGVNYAIECSSKGVVELSDNPLDLMR